MSPVVNRSRVSPVEIARSDTEPRPTFPLGTQNAGRADALARPPGLYTPEQKVKRDQSGWTLVQGILAPLQFLVFLVSLTLVLRYLATGNGLEWATWSVVVKTSVLYLIMVAGCIWEKVVFDVYLFAPAFYWEDVFSMLVLGLHTAYLACVFMGWLNPTQQMLLALAAYGAYVINAGQFLLKLRAARLQAEEDARVAALIEPPAAGGSTQVPHQFQPVSSGGRV